jgi:hypothetical protein
MNDPRPQPLVEPASAPHHAHPRGTFQRLLVWHRRLGLAVSVIVLLLSVTGLLLNHTDALKLDQTSLRADWLLRWYGYPPVAAPDSFRAGERWVSTAGGKLYLDQTPVAEAGGRGLVDYRRIEVDAGRIAFARRGMAVTLNGIAQGYITDRISALLRARGFDNVLVNLGEFRALGGHADGAPWRVAVPDPVQPWRRLRTLALADAALATSGGYGTQFDAAGRHHHLFDPRDGRSAGFYRSVSVLAPDATTADALSTGLSILEPDAARRALAAFPRAGAIFVGRDRTNWSAGALPKA